MKSGHWPRRRCPKFFSSSIFSSGWHSVEPSRTILAILGRGPLEEHSCANILKSGHWPRMKCCLKIFYFLALVAILFNGAELLRPPWISYRYSFSSFRSRNHPVATEQVILDFLSAHLVNLCLLSTLMLTIKF